MQKTSFVCPQVNFFLVAENHLKVRCPHFKNESCAYISIVMSQRKQFWAFYNLSKGESHCFMNRVIFFTFY
jgi:hypothetical protein